MATFVGTNAAEVIGPAEVSPTVMRDPSGSLPGAGADILNGGGGADVVHGAGGDDTVFGYGDVAPDRLYGDDGNDTIFAASADHAYGGAGNDTLYMFESGGATADAGAGDDLLVGSGGNDVLIGGDGRDTASYAAWDDGLGVTVSLARTAAQDTVGAGTDTLEGIENLIGSYRDDHLTGDAGANVLEGLTGANTLDGGGGSDTASYVHATAAVTVSLALTGAQNTQGAGTDTLIGIENLQGSAYDDHLTGNAGANMLEGGQGNDHLDGGGGLDTASYAGASAAVTVSLAIAGAQDTLGAGIDTLVGIENLTGGYYGDHLTGNAGANVLEGGQGNDMLTGGAGDDRLDGGSGYDSVRYDDAAGGVTLSLAITGAQDTHGAGIDTLQGIENVHGSAHDDHLTGDAGPNILEGGQGNDTLTGGAGNDRLDGGGSGGANGYDTVRYADATSGVDVSLAIAGPQDTHGAGIDTLIGIENLNGSAYDDYLTGSDHANVLEGGQGNDTLLGGGGTDRLDGGSGYDTAVFATGSTYDGTVITVSLAIAGPQDTHGDGTVTLIGIENLTTYGSNVAILTGNDGANVLVGGSDSDTLEGGAGNDRLDGGSIGSDTASYAHATGAVTVSLATGDPQDTHGAGIDTLISIENLTGSAHDDTLTGNGAANKLIGGDGDDRLDGGAAEDTASYADAAGGVTVSLAIAGAQDTHAAGSDTLIGIEDLTGSNHDDTLTGNAGVNTLTGGKGADTLAGGAGADTFRFFTGDGSDRITDFTDGVDKLSFWHFGDDNHTAAQIIAHAAQVGADTVITLADPGLGTETVVTLAGFALGNLDAGDFGILVA